MKPSAAPATPPAAPRARASAAGLVLETDAPPECLRWDGAGRWVAWHRRTGTFRASVLGEAFRLRRGRARRLTARRERALLQALRGRAAELARQADASAGPAADILRRAAAAPPEAAQARRELGARAYPHGIPVLPPHRLRDAVVRVADGCPNAACTFCRFYAGREFRALDEAALARHLEAVEALRGAHAPPPTGLFLGEASAASLPEGVLVARLGQALARFGLPRRGAAAFWDPDRGAPRDATAWARLRARGLEDLTLGLETGDPALRSAVGKSPDLGRWSDRVRQACAGGLRIAVCVLAGLVDAQGPSARARHLDLTLRVVEGLRLDAQGRVYVSRLTDARGPRVPRDEALAWARALRGVTPAQVLPYGVESFVPWA